MCVVDRAPKPAIELGAIQNHLLGVNRLDRIFRHDKVPGVFDIDDELRRNLANRADLLATIRDKSVITDLNSSMDPFLLLAVYRWQLPDGERRKGCAIWRPSWTSSRH
jgi:hypothetical protein